MQKSILQEAEEIVNKDRKDTHGDFTDTCERTAAIFNAWTSKNLNSEDVCKLLYCLKMAREHNNPNHRDNYVDQAGYLLLRERMQNKPQDPQTQLHKSDFNTLCDGAVESFIKVKSDEWDNILTASAKAYPDLFESIIKGLQKIQDRKNLNEK